MARRVVPEWQCAVRLAAQGPFDKVGRVLGLGEQRAGNCLDRVTLPYVEAIERGQEYRQPAVLVFEDVDRRAVACVERQPDEEAVQPPVPRDAVHRAVARFGFGKHAEV